MTEEEKQLLNAKQPKQTVAGSVSQILQQLGNPGRYQVILYFCLWVCNSTVTLNHLVMAVFGHTPPHSCKLPQGYQKNGSLPMETVNNKRTYSSCKAYQGFNSSLGSQVSCPDGWQFVLKGKESTIVDETYLVLLSEALTGDLLEEVLPVMSNVEKKIFLTESDTWSLVCDKKYLVSLATTIYFAGVMLGGAVFGQLGDKFGRKPILLFCMYGHIALGIGVYFSNSYTAFATIRFFLGFLIQGIQTTSYVLMAEMTVLKYRAICAGFFEVFWAVGTLWLATLSWAIQDWRKIQLALCLPSLITLFYIVFLPESVLWLVNKNKMSEAKKTLEKIAKFNNKELPKDVELSSLSNEDVTQYSFHHLVKTPKMRRRTLLMCYLWLASSVGYYGLSLSVGGLAGNRYLNQFIGAIVELFAFVSVIIVLKFFRRRYPLMTYYIVGGITCIIAGVVKSQTNPTDTKKLVTALALIGKFGLSAGFATIFLYTVELFPTVVRSLGMGSCVVWARVGGMVAPQILLSGKYTFDELPYLIFGSLSLLAAVVTFFLPETFGKALPNTIEEIEGETEKDLELTENKARTVEM